MLHTKDSLKRNKLYEIQTGRYVKPGNEDGIQSERKNSGSRFILKRYMSIKSLNFF